MSIITIITKNDLDKFLGEEFYPLDQNNQINLDKINFDIDAVHSEIETYLLRCYTDLSILDAVTINQLKPIAIDLAAYRLMNAPNESNEQFEKRRNVAIATLENFVKMKQVLNTKQQTSGIQYFKLIR